MNGTGSLPRAYHMKRSTSFNLACAFFNKLTAYNPASLYIFKGEDARDGTNAVLKTYVVTFLSFHSLLNSPDINNLNRVAKWIQL